MHAFLRAPDDIARRSGRNGKRSSPLKRRRFSAKRSYTLVELMVVMAILTTISTIAVVEFLPHLAQARNSSAVDDIRTIERAITRFLVENGHLPASLEDALSPVPLDPWGNPYQYLRIDASGTSDSGKENGNGNGSSGGGDSNRGKWRKDRFLVPINSDYDLYSFGPDGRSSPPLTAKHSRDDIVRGGNGGFVGTASDY